MSTENPRWYKWFPTEACDLGTMPFEGDFTTDDRIYVPDSSGIYNIFTSNVAGTEFGRTVKVKIGGRIKSQWKAGVPVPAPIYGEIDGQQLQLPVWFAYYGDGLCVAKLPAGETVEHVET